MVTRKSQPVQRKTRRSTARSVASPASAARRVPVAEMKATLDLAGRKLQVAGKAATRFARSSVREVRHAAESAREPMQALLHAMRLAGRHIVRDARAAWFEVVPRSTLKRPTRAGHRPAA
jgi:hypothetical protein